MQSHTLQPKTKRTKSRQIGRGGTRGKTSGKGTKGQNARAGRKKRPEIRDFIKRFPKLRGRGVSSFKSFQVKPIVVNLALLEESYKAGETVSIGTLVEKKVIDVNKGKSSKVKILGTGDISKKLVFENVLLSTSAKAKIEKAGGTIR